MYVNINCTPTFKKNRLEWEERKVLSENKVGRKMEGDELMLEGWTIFRKFPSLTFYHRFY